MNPRIIDEEEQGTRVDRLVTDELEESRSVVQQWVKEGWITVNGGRVKNNYKLQAGDRIDVTIPEDNHEEMTPEEMDLDVRYEDDDVVVIYKPRGMVVHPAPGHARGTLMNGLLHRYPLWQHHPEARAGLIHRLDKDTSGLLIAAKHPEAYEQLSAQMKERKIERKYKAIVHGEVPHETGKIDMPIGRDPHDRQKMAAVRENSKPAVTHFQVLQWWHKYTFVECELETGRMHQIRVHFAEIGHPVAADPKYGRRKTLSLPGQALHAYRLRFEHPVSGEWVEVEAELPEEMQAAIDELNKTS
jgi:23S rRNA pseudouridine1911/1915/1917 synthase